MYHHARSGLNLTMFRAYNPALGRWLSRDPMGEAAGGNLYAYVENSPINLVDPLGLAVKIGYRNATGIPGITGAGQHMVIILTPDNPSDFSNNALFANGNTATLAGEPTAQNAPPCGPFGRLKKMANDPSDAPGKLHDITDIATPYGLSDTQFIKAILKAFNSYTDNAIYWPYWPNGVDSANSNNFAAGLIRAGGGFIPLNPSTGRGPLMAPGGNHPMNLPYIPW